MAVEHSLRIPGGAAGVAERGCGTFIETRPRVLARMRGDPGLVAHQSRDARVRGQRIRLAERDPVLHGRALRSDRFHQRQEAQVEAEDLVLGVVHDPDQLVGRQTRVERVDHAPTAAHAVVELEVAVAVPSERRDARALRKAECIEGVGEAA